MTNEQDNPYDADDVEPTQRLGEPDEPTPAPADEDTTRLWSQPEPYQPSSPAPPVHPQPQPYPYAYGQPAGQPPSGQQPYPQPSYQPPAYEPMYAEPAPEEPKARVPGWLWPVVAATALVVGTIGGAIGGTIVAGDEGGNDGFFDSTEEPSTIDEGGSSGSQAPLPEDNGSVAAVAAKLLPSTVQVNAEGASGAGGTGSGFVVDDKGHVITNNHVVADATGDGELEVVDHAGRVHAARIVGRSTVYDIAVLSIDNFESLQPAAIGSSRKMRIGETVVAIGSPLGLSRTVTSGIVSAIDRPVTTGNGEESSYINAVQTDAAINPGNSGGPLVNLRGEVIGVNSAIATTGGVGAGEAGSIGVGFAIPMEQVRVTANQILATGEAQYPVIGATVNTVKDKRGANIVEVNPDTPAERAGLRPEDLVVAIDGKPIEDSIGLIVAIRSHQPGETVTLTVARGGSQDELRVKLAAEPDRP